MTIQVLQAAGSPLGSAQGGTSPGFTNPVTSGSVLWVGFTANTASNPVTSVTDNINSGNYLTAVTQQDNTGQNTFDAIYYFPNSKPGSVTVTIQFVGTISVEAVLMELGGVSSLDVTASGTTGGGASATPTTNPFSTTAPAELLTAYASSASGTSRTWAAQGTWMLQASLTSCGSQSKVVSSKQSNITAAMTATTSDTTNRILMASFMQASSQGNSPIGNVIFDYDENGEIISELQTGTLA